MKIRETADFSPRIIHDMVIPIRANTVHTGFSTGSST
ncbi:hypothetical protein PAM7971_02603 [Pacificibacter marinus]|uniref:Uncharacterized protein n=1 Tax=Pacificibacter marinus TaxID=658057 RepID=A0A1Y5SZY7_9RHOB|nr:hypothetical protein PAM7971_02603 [Pacificibacter marinus]